MKTFRERVAAAPGHLATPMRLPSSVNLGGRTGGNGSQARCHGAVLLEVILALALFVAAAAILTSGLSSSLDGVERLRFNTHAADLAVTVASELQMGIRSLALTGPQPFDPPREGWTWEVTATPRQAGVDDNSEFKMVEVIIRHADPDVVYRLGQVLRLGETRLGGDNAGNPEDAPEP